jgi:hypothetical protein
LPACFAGWGSIKEEEEGIFSRFGMLYQDKSGNTDYDRISRDFPGWVIKERSSLFSLCL